jgi:hypothetical protein
MATMSIDGKIYTGNNINIINGDVYIDGVKQDPMPGISNRPNIEITGNVESVAVDVGSVTVKGNVTGNVKAGGSVNCDAVGGDVHASGSVNCDEVGGSINAGGSVNCDDVNGSVSAGGNVRYG